MKYRVHVAGPDDIEDFDDELEALRTANQINKQFLEFNSDKWDDHTFVLMCATVSEIDD